MSSSQAALRTSDLADPFETALTVAVTDRNGREHLLPAEEGWRLMEVIRDWGLDIKAECGGACACATCHVHVHPDWIGQLQPPTAEEIDMLDDAFEVTEASRLSCQILLSPALNGLQLRLVAGTEK